MANLGIKIGSTVASLAGVAIANKALSAGWKTVTGNEPPEKNDDLEESFRDVIIWAAITGFVGTAIKVYVSRWAAEYERKRQLETGGQDEV